MWYRFWFDLFVVPEFSLNSASVKTWVSRDYLVEIEVALDAKKDLLKEHSGGLVLDLVSLAYLIVSEELLAVSVNCIGYFVEARNAVDRCRYEVREDV